MNTNQFRGYAKLNTSLFNVKKFESNYEYAPSIEVV